MRDGRGDLLTVFECLGQHVDHEVSELRDDLAEALDKLPAGINPRTIPVLKDELISSLLPMALKKLQK